MAYLELIVKVNQPTIEIASDFLISEIGFSGVITEENYVHLENTFGIIKAYAAENEISFNNDEIQQKLLQKRAFLVECGFSDEELGDWISLLTLVEDESWSENWKKYWNVQKIGQKTIICPSWIDYEPQKDEIKIELDPGSAFGTGTHPTTRLCICELEKYVSPDKTVADIGCGSGILAIAAKKLEAKTVIGVDIDVDSIRVSKENADINNVSCDFSEGTIEKVTLQYDIVVANILANVIVDIMPELKRITKPDGVMILSGIIEEKAQDVLDAMKKYDVKFVSQEIEAGNGENWVGIVGKL